MRGILFRLWRDTMLHPRMFWAYRRWLHWRNPHIFGKGRARKGGD
jgi:hypothetical protein